jgi:hypothetical protein
MAIVDELRHDCRMPIELRIHRPDRIAMGVTQGEVTLQDLEGFAGKLVETETLHYRKIIHVTSGTLKGSELDMAVFSERIRDMIQNKRSGPIAIVVDPERGEFSRLFVQQTAGGRPGRVFHSVHDAREWLLKNFSVE